MTILNTGLAVTALTVIATALYAPDHIGDRAFRLLPGPPSRRRPRLWPPNCLTDRQINRHARASACGTGATVARNLRSSHPLSRPE
jgi:hypothetical protein